MIQNYSIFMIKCVQIYAISSVICWLSWTPIKPCTACHIHQVLSNQASIPCPISDSTNLHYNALHILQPVIRECQKLEWESKTEAKNHMMLVIKCQVTWNLSINFYYISWIIVSILYSMRFLVCLNYHFGTVVNSYLIHRTFKTQLPVLWLSLSKPNSVVR